MTSKLVKGASATGNDDTVHEVAFVQGYKDNRRWRFICDPRGSFRSVFAWRGRIYGGAVTCLTCIAGEPCLNEHGRWVT